jgi:hypothetical protein
MSNQGLTLHLKGVLGQLRSYTRQKKKAPAALGSNHRGQSKFDAGLDAPNLTRLGREAGSHIACDSLGKSATCVIKFCGPR